MGQDRVERDMERRTNVCYKAVKPLGLEDVCEEMERICAQAPLYRYFGRKPDNLIVCLDPGEGRTTVTEYAADRFKECGVLDFASGLDDFITVKLDGTLSQYKRAMAQIRDAAVYQNHYTGVIEADVMALASHRNETQYSSFFTEFPEVCRYAYVLFFAPAKPSGNEGKFLEKLTFAMGCAGYLTPDAYTKGELAEIAMRRIEGKGILVEEPQNAHLLLCDMAECLGIQGVKGIGKLAEEAVRLADYSKAAPVIRREGLQALLCSVREYSARYPFGDIAKQCRVW